MLNHTPYRKMNDMASWDAEQRYISKGFFFCSLCHAWLNLSAANHSNNVVSALLAFRKSGFGMIVLIIVVIATVYTMQIVSQSNRLDFLPPDGPLANSGAVRCAACGFDLQGWGVGWMEGCVEGKQKYTACLGIVSGHWFRSLAADALCQVVEMQCEMQLRYWDRGIHRHTNPPRLSLYLTHTH